MAIEAEQLAGIGFHPLLPRPLQGQATQFRLRGGDR